MNPTENASEKVIIHWRTKDEDKIRRIRKRFCIPTYTTVNGMSPAMLRHEDTEIFEETARRGYFSYRKTDWTFNGTSYSW